MTNATINININAKGAEKSLTTLQADIEATEQELSRLVKTYGENSKEADKMRKTLVGLEVEMNKLGGSVEMAENSTQSLKSQLRQLQNELAKLEPGSARFQELSNKAAGLKEQIQDANDVVRVLAGNTSERLIRGLGGAVQIGVAGFQALQSSLVLFGVENEEVSKSIQRMTALLNLSQALETFAGFDQKLVEIKASFNSLTGIFQKQNVVQAQGAVASGVASVAMDGQAVATTAAAGATTVLGTAMKALPIIGIIAAIASLVYGIYQYVNASGDAEKQEKKRTETLKRQREEEQKQTDTIAKESAEYVSLIYQLKATNNGSKERRDLIKEINSTYNTTLQNLSDETSFQKQLNLEVANYITYQKAKFQLQKNEELVQKNLIKQDEINKKILKTRNELTTLTNIQLGQDDLRAGKISMDIRDTTLTLKELEAELASAEKRLASYGKVSLDASSTIKDIEGTTGKYNTTLKENTNATKDATEAQKDYDDALRDISKILDETTKLEEENFIKTQELSKNKVDLSEIERKKRTESVRKVYTEIKLNIEKEIKDQTKKYELLAILDKRWADFQKEMDEQTVLDKSLSNQKILENQKTLIETLRIEEEALKNEIRFGDGDTSDTLISNSNKVLNARIRNIDTELVRSQIQSDLSLKQFETLTLQKETMLNEYYVNERDSQIAAAKAEKERLILLEKDKYNVKEDFLITYNNKTGEILVEIKNEEKLTAEASSEEQKQILKNLITEKELLQKNLNTTVENLNTELNQKIATTDADFALQKIQLDADTEDAIFDKRIQRLNDYINFAQEAFSGFNNVVQQAQEQRLEQQTQELDDFANLEQDKLNQQLENRLISQEEYDSRVRQLEIQKEQEMLQLKRKQFQQDKSLNIVQATIDATRGTLSAFANTPGGIIVKTIAAGLAAAFGAVQIGLIAKQEFRAAIGGIVPSNGLSGNADSVPATLAPGEAVINSNSTSSFLPMLDMINRMGGGKSLMPELPGDNGINRFQPVYQQQGSNQPVRAYVVSSDIENNMSRLNRIRRSTRF